MADFEHFITAIGGPEVVIRNNQAEIITIQAKTDANQKEMKGFLASRIYANEEKTDAEVRAWRKETRACQEATEACLESKEPTSVETESVAEHQEVPKEEAAVKTARALLKRHGDRHLDVGRREKPRKRTQGDGGYRKKFVAACRGMTRRAITARRKGHCCQGQGKDKAVPRTQKGRKFGTRRRAKLEGISGIRNQGFEEQLCLRKETAPGRIFGKTIGLEIVKRTVRSRTTSDWTWWRVGPPPKRKKRPLTTA
jgi:hypothetical protein